jgi:tetratricopeptide (TPR) repeat protein
VRFEGTPPRSVERESENFQVKMEKSVNLENAWEGTEGTGGSQEFTLVISTGNDVTVVELYARLPNRRLIVGGLCRANVYDVFAPVIRESLMSIRLDRRVLQEPLKVEDVAKAKEWKIEAEARLTQAYLAPGNLHRAIAAFRQAIWHLPAGFVDDDIDVADLKRKLEQNCKELNDRFEARKLQVKSEHTLTGRFERAVDAAEDLVQEIPDFRDDRSYLAGSIYPQVRMRFPDLKWHPKLLERIRYQ